MACFLLCAVMTILISMALESSGLHIHIEHNNFEALTCYTCPMKKDNEHCNNWAPDIPCPFRHTVCKTVHRIKDTTGESIQVDKLCALPEQCTSNHVGCNSTGNDGEIECVSCCTESYCNIAVPYNVSTSQTLSASLIGSTASHMTIINWPMVVVAFILGNV